MPDLQTLLSKFLIQLYAGNVTFTAQSLAGDGTAPLPAYSFASEPTLGFRRTSAALVGLEGGLTSSATITALNYILGATGYVWWNGRALLRSPADGALTLNNQAESGFASLGYGPAAGATTGVRLQKKITGIADNSATTVFTVTIPNATHACSVNLTFLSSNGSTDAFESARAANGLVVITRTAGLVAVCTAAAIADGVIATEAASATHTLAYSATQAGGAGASNTVVIAVTIDDSGNTGGNQVVAVAELLNAEAVGCTIA